MPHYTVGLNWPDNFYSSNAKWPEANKWHYREDGRQSAFRASTDEAKRARALEEQEAARREVRKLQKSLFAAIVQRDLPTVRSLLRAHPLLLERRTRHGATPLGLAAAVGDESITAALLDEGADVTAGDAVGATPLIAAAFRGHAQVCRQLLASKQGGDAGRGHLLRQATARGESAALAAAKAGRLAALGVLVEAAGAAEAMGGLAAAGGVDVEGVDALMMAARNDHTEVMAFLMDRLGLSPSRPDAHGRTALMHAAGGGALQAVRLLLERRSGSIHGTVAPPAAQAAGAAPTHGPVAPPAAQAVSGGGPAHASAAPTPAGDALAAVDSAGYGPLHHACLGGSVEVVELLTRAGCSLGAPADPRVLALLAAACRAGHAGVVDWMLRAGIGLPQLVADGEDANPMFAAVRGGSGTVVDVLLAHGARIDPRDSRGRTPLAVAATAGLTPLCRRLVAAGAELRAADTHGVVPRRAAYLARRPETAEALADLARGRLLREEEYDDGGRRD